MTWCSRTLSLFSVLPILVGSAACDVASPGPGVADQDDGFEEDEDEDIARDEGDTDDLDPEADASDTDDRDPEPDLGDSDTDNRDPEPDLRASDTDALDLEPDLRDSDTDALDPEPDLLDGDTDDVSPDPRPQPQPIPRPEAVEPCDWETAWEGQACVTEGGREGMSYCIMLEGEEFYTPCEEDYPACIPGDGYDQGCTGSICTWNGDALEAYSWHEPDCNTPLVLMFEGERLEFAPALASAFDLSRDGTCVQTDWPTSPWLALDRDGDGAIRSGAELFGNATVMAAGGRPDNGFSALAELDSNRDGKISAQDDRFEELVLWTDTDDDRIGTGSELRSLKDVALVSIDLGWSKRLECDDSGNCGVERAPFVYTTADGTLAEGEVVDVHLFCQ